MEDKSVDAMANELREAYMQMKDLSSRCMIDMENISKNDERVFYFKPNSEFLNEPEKQRQNRLNFLNKMKSLKEPFTSFSLAQQFEIETKETVLDRQLNDPADMRPYLADFYQRRLYNMQHKKYKILARWAHFALTSNSIDRIGQQGTFIYGRLEFEIENAMKRFERLCQKDGYEEIRDGQTKRPQTHDINDRKKGNHIDQAIEREDNLSSTDRTKDPISCIRMDDFEVYLRIQTYQNKLNRPLQKVISKCKWIPTTNNIKIFKDFHIKLKQLQQSNYYNQIDQVKRLRERFNQVMMKKTDDLIVEMEEILLEDYPAQRINLENQITSQAKSSQSSQFKRIPKIDMIVEKAPLRIQNIIELYQKIEIMASDFGIFGDVEIDGGSPFTYQVQVYFTTYYRKQIIESTFNRYNDLSRDPQQSQNSVSNILETNKMKNINYKGQNNQSSYIDDLYEKFNGDFAQDFSEVQKRNLRSLLMVDFKLLDLQNTNADGNSLPLLKKGKKINEQIPDLKKMFGDVKVIRLKRASWLDTEPLIKPNICESIMKQNTAISNDNYFDLQMQTLLDFIDIGDPSVVNNLYASIAKLYEKMAKNEYSLNYTTEDVKLNSDQFNDVIASKFHKAFTNGLIKNKSENIHKDKLSLEQIEKMKQKRFINQDRMVVDTTMSPLRRLPAHLVQCYFTLKHMKMRDLKNRLLKVLNFYRSVQKRIAFELREFSQREAVNNDIKVKLPQESHYLDTKASCLEENFQDIGQIKNSNGSNKIRTVGEKEAELELEEDENIANLIDIKRWKYKGQFVNKFLNTCPQPIIIDGRSDRPIEEKDYKSYQGMLRQTKQHISEEAKGFINRIDQYKFDESQREIQVIDDFGVSVMYDCSIQDMVTFEENILLIGSHFIQKNEEDFDFEKFEYALIDRIEVLHDILDCELDYQFQKSQIVIAYLDVLEHCVDPLIQQRLMQTITDIMAWRPKIDYQRSWYFKTSYCSELQYLKTLLKILQEAINYQMAIEKIENQNVRDYLNAAFKVTDAYTNMAWSDVDTNQVKTEIEERRYIQGGMRQPESKQSTQINKDQVQTQQQNNIKNEQSASEMQKNELEKNTNTSPQKKINIGSQEKQDKPTFVEMLGLQAPDLRDQMINQTALESNVEDFIDQDANFIKTQEGYPYFFRNTQDNLSNVKFSNGTSSYNSRPFGILDFYESLSIVSNFYALISQGQDELKNDLKPAGPIEQNLMNTAFLEIIYVELLNSKNQSTSGQMTDYNSQQLIESDLVVSNPDKIIFLVKDMIATLNKSFKKSLNPFWIAKLDVNSVNHFPFPEIQQSYFLSEKGNKNDVGFDRNFIETQLKPSQNLTHFFPKLRDEEKNINIPPMLLVFCNLIEMLRMREKLILAIIDTKVIETHFEHQKSQVNKESERTGFLEHLNIDCSQFIDSELVNFVEQGSLLFNHPHVDSGLAIDEICPTLRANLNFRSPESIQTLTLDGGLDNLKVSLHYQIIQKQLLQNAMLSNYIIMTPYQKAISEIDLLLEHGIKMPNGVIEYHKIFSGPKKIIDIEKLKSIKSSFISQFRNQCSSFFKPVNQHKIQVRQTIKKLWEEQKIRLSQLGHEKKSSKQYGHQLPQPINKFTMIRLLYDYKHSLVHVACRQISQNIHQDAWKVQLLNLTHKELKNRLNYFGGLSQENHLFRFEKSHNQDCEPIFLKSEQLKFTLKNDIFDELNKKGENFLTNDIISIIPSIQSIMNLQHFSIEGTKSKDNEKSLFEKLNNLIDYSTNNLELLIYKNLSSQFNIENKQTQFIKALFDKDTSNEEKQNNQENLDKCSLPCKLVKLYQNIILQLEFILCDVWFNIKPIDQIEIQNAADQNRQYWKIEESNFQEFKVEQQGESTEDEIESKTLLIEDECLSQKIIEKISLSRKLQQQVFDEFTRVANEFNQFKIQIQKMSKGFNINLDQAIQSIQDINKLSQLNFLKTVLNSYDDSILQNENTRYFQEITRQCKILSGIDLTLPFFTNGMILNDKWYSPRNLRLDYQILSDYEVFKQIIKGLIFEEDLIPMNCNLACNLIQTLEKSKQICSQQQFNYVGQLQFKEGQLLNELRLLSLNQTENCHQKRSRSWEQAKTNFQNLLISDEMGAHKDLESVSTIKKISILSNLIESQLLKFMYMIMIAGRTFPIQINSNDFQRDFNEPFMAQIGWKISQSYQAEIKRRNKISEQQSMKNNQISNNEAQLKIQAKDSLESAIKDQLRSAVQKAPQKTIAKLQQDEAAHLYLKSQCQRSILRNEIEKILIQSGIVALSSQVAAIQKCLEMSSNKIDKHLSSKQRFCATLFDDINRHQHLEVVSKLNSIQIFLTKTRNRGLPMKTLTSGPGIVFTFKDLNECIHDFANEMMTFGEKQLKLRTESYQLQINQLTEIIQYKDLKIDSLKLRSAHVYDNIVRVSNAKVFEQGNALVFALDKAMSKVRFYEDHIHEYEKELKNAIREEFRIQLQKQSQTIAGKDKKLNDMHQRIVHTLNELVVSEQIKCNEKIRKMAMKVTNLDQFNLDQQVRVDMSKQKIRMNKMAMIVDNNIVKNKEKGPQISSEDSNLLVTSEQACKIILQLQSRLNTQRTFWDMRYQLMKQKFEEKIFMLENRLSSNQSLWEGMKNGEQRQKILQQELGITQKAAQQNEKLIGKLKEEFQKNVKDKQVLENLQVSRLGKLKELEHKSKHFELSKNVDVQKLISSLISQDSEINSLKNSLNHLQSKMKMDKCDFNNRINEMKRQIEIETEQKNSAIHKVEILQAQLKIWEAKNSSEKQTLIKTKFDEMQIVKVNNNLIKENQILINQINILKSQIQLIYRNKNCQENLNLDLKKSLIHERDDISQMTRTTSYQYGGQKNFQSSFEKGNLFMSNFKNENHQKFLKTKQNSTGQSIAFEKQQNSQIDQQDMPNRNDIKTSQSQDKIFNQFIDESAYKRETKQNFGKDIQINRRKISNSQVKLNKPYTNF